MVRNSAQSVKISCLPVSLFSDIATGKITLGQWAKKAKEIGLDAIDISMILLKNHTPTYLKGLRRELAAEKIQILMATAYPDFTHPEAMQRMREMEYLRRDIALCSQLGIRYLRVLAGQAHPGVSREEGVSWAVENLTQAALAAGKYGVTLLYEDHAKPGAWEYMDFSFPPDIFLEIAKKVAGTGIKINFDTGNIVAYGADPLTILNEVIEEVETIHLSDTAEKGAFSPVVIGTGAVPNKEILSVLKRRGFDGWICIEEASGTGYDGIEKAVRFVRDAWDAVGSEAD